MDGIKILIEDKVSSKKEILFSPPNTSIDLSKTKVKLTDNKLRILTRFSR